MQSILKQLEAHAPWKQSMRKCCRLNKLNVDLVSYFTPLRFRAAYQKFQAIYLKRAEEKIERWLENELKAFYWAVVAISCIQKLPITQFTGDQWQTLAEIFYFKQPLTLEYQGRKLIEEAANRQIWEAEEESLLSSIVKHSQDSANKWNEFARRLFEVSEKRYFRTGKQCRERWLNHLDPSKKHGEWTEEEDKEVVRLFIIEGKRWSQVAKKLGSHRTEHMVKNRYKTILARQKKLFPHIGNENTLIRSYLDPSAASKKQSRKIKEEDEQKQEQNQCEEQHPVVTIKSQYKSNEEHQIKTNLQSQRQAKQEEEDKEQEIDNDEFLQLQGIEVEKGPLPTTSAFQLPQVYSPWYVGIPITPTFSPSIPFFVNLSNFSSFETNFANQFYCPQKSNQKTQH